LQIAARKNLLQIGLLRRGWPEVDIYGSIHYYHGGIDFLEYVDIFCTNINVHPPRLSSFGADTARWERKYSGFRNFLDSAKQRL
jgi:hypothetical protein